MRSIYLAIIRGKPLPSVAEVQRRTGLSVRAVRVLIAAMQAVFLSPPKKRRKHAASPTGTGSNR